MKLRILLFISISVLLGSCSSTSKLTNNTNSQKLIFGNGGGYTGTYNTYELNDDGKLFTHLTDSTLTPIKKLQKKQTREIFDQANRLRIAQPAFNHPGNMTSFIKYQAGGLLTEYKWGEKNFSVPAEILDLYAKLNTIVK